MKRKLANTFVTTIGEFVLSLIIFYSIILFVVDQNHVIRIASFSLDIDLYIIAFILAFLFKRYGTAFAIINSLIFIAILIYYQSYLKSFLLQKNTYVNINYYYYLIDITIISLIAIGANLIRRYLSTRGITIFKTRHIASG